MISSTNVNIIAIESNLIYLECKTFKKQIANKARNIIN